jgi:4-hydroxybenzoate polyprenyltransferase
MIICIGIAGIGYALNDIIDYEADLKNKKRNLFINTSKMQSAVFVITFILFAIFPWYYLPFSTVTVYFLIIEFVLFFLYAFPPFRLKEKGILGILADALYAQVIPNLLAVYTFLKLSETLKLNYFFLILFSVWLLLVGIRNILKHQIEDCENDIHTNTNTFVTKNGKLLSEKISYYIAKIEIIIFCVLLFLLKTPMHFILILYAVYVLLLLLSKELNKNAIALFDFINSRILNEFYEIHLPVLLLIYFSFVQHFFILILLFNIVLFYPIYKSFIVGFHHKYL